jgi:uncharacterized protein involved in outer membrane biogenesis
VKAAPKVLAALVLAIVILLVLAIFFVNTLIRKGIEGAGSRSLGTEVTLSGANLSFLKGQLALVDLRIANPQGFKTDQLFQVASAKTAMRPGTLFEDEVIIDDIVLESPSLTIEQSVHGTNLAALMANIQGEGTKEDGAAEQKSYRIKVLRITGAEVTFSSLLTTEAPVTVPLPDIRIENLSDEDGTGLILAQVIETVLVRMLRAAIVEGQGEIPSEIISSLRGDLGQYVPELGGGALDAAKSALEKMGEKVKGMFK